MYTDAINRRTAEGNGVATNFFASFKILEVGHLQVYRYVVATGVTTLLTRGTDYLATVEDDYSGVTVNFVQDDGEGGLEPYAPPSGHRFVFLRVVPYVQNMDLRNRGRQDQEALERQLDLLTMGLVQIAEEISRSIRVSVAGVVTNPESLIEQITTAVLAAQAAQAAAVNAKNQAEAAQGFAEAAQEDAEAAQVLAEAARDAAIAAASSTPIERLDALERGLASAEYRRAIGDTVSARGYFLNGWLDPLTTDDAVTSTGGGSFVSSGGGYLTNAGADDHVAALDLTAAQFLDEKGSITTLTIDTANTSGHFDAPVNARIKAECRIVLSNGGVYPIMSITGDGTAANSVVFTGTLEVNSFGVAGIYGARYTATAVGTIPAGLTLAGRSVHGTTQALTGGTASASSTYSSNAPAAAFDGVTTATTGWYASAMSPQWLKYDLGASGAKALDSYTIYPYTNANYAPKTWEFQGSNDNTNWTTLDSRSGITDWTAGVGKTYLLTNTTVYRYYRLYIAENVNQGVNCPGVAELIGKAWETTRASGVVYPLSMSVDCTDWTALKSIARTETLNSQSIWYALSFDNGTTYSAFVGSAWLPIVRNNAGTWEYWTGAMWSASTINSALGAMAQAAGVAGNRMTGATMAGLSQAQIEGAGGFTGGQTSMPVLAALYSASSTATPVLSAMSMTSDIQPHDMVAEFDAFEAQAPDIGLALFVMQAIDSLTMGVDVKAWMKRGAGSYEEVPMDQGEPFDSSTFLFYGEVDMSSGSGDATQFRITTHNHKELRIFMAENNFREV